MLREVIITPATLGPAVQALYREIAQKSVQAGVQALRKAASLCMGEAIKAVDAVRPYPPIDTGAPGIKGSFRVTPRRDGAVLDTTAPHAVFMEFGTRPHWAPIGPLLAWAERKERGAIRSRKKRLASDEVKALAYGTQRKIAERGTAPRGFYAAASLKFPGIVEEQIRFAFAKLGLGGTA